VSNREARRWTETASVGIVSATLNGKIDPMRPRPTCRAVVLATALYVLLALGAGCGQPTRPGLVTDPAAHVDPFIGTASGGNTFPGAVVPFGMVAWSPETTRGDPTRRPAPGGYRYDATRVRGFSLTHLSGTGCRGASGDVPFMPYTDSIRSSPSADTADRRYTTGFAHANETAAPGYYQVRLASGVNVEFTATARTGYGRFAFPAGRPATLLIRTSDSEVGSSDAQVTVDSAAHTVTGSVTSGNFCGYIHAVNRRSYYTVHFVAVFDRPFVRVGTWEDGKLEPGGTTARGGTTYGSDGYPVRGKGSGAYVEFDPEAGPTVEVRVGISYVSLANARANLQAESPDGTGFDTVRGRAYESWNRALAPIQVGGGTSDQLTTFYTALYHSLLHPNVFSDVNGEYRGFDGAVHDVAGPQKAQYANFSGWDVYRSQLQLVTLLDPKVGSDIAQSLLNQADQSGGEWDRWTHNSGATHVMEGDPSPPAVAGIVAFGGTDFDLQAAFASLLHAARVPTAHDLSDEGCPVECVGQRPSLDAWLSLHYIPTVSNAWGGAGETLEDVTADFSLAQLARRLGDDSTYNEFQARTGYWRNVFNPEASATAGYIQNRNSDGSWPELDPASSRGFAEGSSAQYTWMVPFDVGGLFEVMGGPEAANRRLDAFFHNSDGSWALTALGGLHAEMDNEPSVGAPWLYLFAGRPYRTQEAVRRILDGLWSATPYGLPGNDDLGAMSSWYVWSAMGMYPGIPGRAELLLASPLFPRIVVQRPDGTTINITAPRAGTAAFYVRGLRVDGRATRRPWLPEPFIVQGGRLEYDLAAVPDTSWGAGPDDVPPSFPPSPNAAARTAGAR
jgi:predicted alpha-1,2-mannosidase